MKSAIGSRPVELRAGGLEGEHVYVLATGASLLSEDLSLLEDEVVWGYGELVCWPGFTLTPSVYTLSKYEGWRRWRHLIKGDGPRLIYYYKSEDVPEDFDGTRVVRDSNARTLLMGQCGGLDDELDWVASCPARAISGAVQPAIWMRPKSITLLGFDFSRHGKVQNPEWDGGDAWDVGGYYHRRTMQGLEVLKGVCDSLDIELVNATQGTNDTVLPRATLAQLQEGRHG